MANSEHVAKLQEGVQAWNDWRDQNSYIRPDFRKADLGEARRANLSRADLSGADFRGANLIKTNLIKAILDRADLRRAHLSGAYLSEANLSRADLSEAYLRGADLSKAYLRGANLSGANLRRANLSGANLSQTNLSQANFSQTHLHRTNLSGANLTKVDLRRANLTKTDLSKTDLRRADLRRAYLSGANLSEANLSQTNFSQTNFSGTDLSRVNFSEADLSRTNLTGTNLVGANLRRAYLRGAYLRGVDFHGAYLTGADLAHAVIYETIFANVDLTDVKGLESCVHKGPSTIDYRTLERSDKLPLSFLRGCGLPDIFIDYLPSLLNQPIRHHSCFISYSHNDKSFARRLYDHLQDRGIRCWLDDKDIRVGDPILDAVNEAIRVHDKVLLCCSKASLTSTWVEDEIAMTFEKERKYKSLVLIPLDLDTYLFEHWFSGKAPRIRERLAADFTGWEQDNKKFKAQFERVVRALQTDEEARGKP